MNNPVRILLIDDHTLFRESLVRLLEVEPAFLVVAHCASVAEAIAILDSNAIDVVLLDYDLGEEVGTALLPGLRAHSNTPKILMVTAGMRDSVTRDILKAGISGVIFKHSGPSQLIEAIHRVAQGEMWLDTAAIRSLIATTDEKPTASRSVQPLTDRQREVLRGILDGLTNKEIAVRLRASESSIKAVIQELFHKAGARTRSQLERIALEKYSKSWLG